MAVKLLDPARTGKAAERLREDLEARIIGQPEAIQQIVSSYQTYITGMCSPGRPICNFLFLGSTGGGKTHSVESLAASLLGDPRAVLKIDCGEFQHSHEIAKLIGCFAPGTPVLMADGGTKPIEDIVIGDMVIAGDGVPRPVLDTYEYDQDGDMVELNVASNNVPVVVTPDHEVYAIRVGANGKRVRNPKSLYRPENIERVKAKDLQKKDIVVYPRYKPAEIVVPTLDLAKYARELEGAAIIEDSYVAPYNKRLNIRGTKIRRFIEIDENFMRLAGYYVAEGGNSTDRSSINFTLGIPHKQPVIDDVRRLIPLVFNPVSIRDECHIRDEDRSDRGSVRMYFCSQLVALMMADLFGDHTLRKHVPAFFFDLPENLLWEFVDAAIMGDGCCTEPRRIDYSTSSATLHEQLNFILRSRLGVTTQKQWHASTKKDWADRYRTYIAGAQIDWVVKKLPLAGPKVDLAGARYDSPTGGIQRGSHADSDYVYFQLKGTKLVPYKGKVYDISIDTEHSYVVDFKVSNSPPGYLGHRETHPLLSQEAINQFQTEKNKVSFVLFDEIEKASDAMWNLLLGILDKAVLTLGDNKRVDFSRCMIFMTSNLGAVEISRILRPDMGFSAAVVNQKHGSGEVDEATQAQIARSGLEAARKKFTPEFMNRLDKIVVFRSLNTEDLDLILNIELNLVQQRIFNSLTALPFVITVTDAARKYLLREGVDAKYGARHLKRVIERSMVHQLSNLLASEQIRGGDLIEVDYVEAEPGSEEPGKMTFSRMEENMSASGMMQIVQERVVTPRPRNGKTAPSPVDPLKNILVFPDGREGGGRGRKPGARGQKQNGL